LLDGAERIVSELNKNGVEGKEWLLDRQLWRLVERFKESNSFCFGVGIVNVSDLRPIVYSSRLNLGERLIVVGGNEDDEEEDKWVLKEGSTLLLIIVGADQEGRAGKRVDLDIHSANFNFSVKDAEGGQLKTEGECAVLEKAVGGEKWAKVWLGVGF